MEETEANEKNHVVAEQTLLHPQVMDDLHQMQTWSVHPHFDESCLLQLHKEIIDSYTTLLSDLGSLSRVTQGLGMPIDHQYTHHLQKEKEKIKEKMNELLPKFFKTAQFIQNSLTVSAIPDDPPYSSTSSSHSHGALNFRERRKPVYIDTGLGEPMTWDSQEIVAPISLDSPKELQVQTSTSTSLLTKQSSNHSRSLYIDVPPPTSSKISLPSNSKQFKAKTKLTSSYTSPQSQPMSPLSPSSAKTVPSSSPFTEKNVPSSSPSSSATYATRSTLRLPSRSMPTSVLSSPFVSSLTSLNFRRPNIIGKRNKSGERLIWTYEEEVALEKAMHEFGNQWTLIAHMHGERGQRDQTLARFNQHSLKDKARTLRKQLLKRNLDLGVFHFAPN
ncbi:hypothetical protein HMI54_012763 [Coelomomyces lativittatus]|nr:hypothetical protein HMI56_003214 [Coelomomyces lativittatus]KAJ1505444.1 hypothetical protein HMI55_001588 [Coelomomyces lativittatus]KAJ1515178.1 hypothetical protein HMI54_012763 [Coelomomyces lativittatus]